MKILLISAYYPPDKGSAAVLYHELGGALANAGHQVTVLTTLPGYLAGGDLRTYRWRLWHRERAGTVDVLRVASPRLPRRLIAGRAFWQFGAALSIALAGIARSSHDAALVYSPPLPLGLSAWCISRLRGTPFVLNVQDLFPQSVVDLGLLKSQAARSFFEWMERWLYRRAEAIAVHSRGNADFVVARGAPPEKVFVIDNWVDTDFIRPDGDGMAFRRRHGLGDSFVVSFAGVLGLSQDVDVILGAADILREQAGIQWIVVGDGVERQRLVEAAKARQLDRVRFLPMVPYEYYPEVLYASDVGLATLRANVRTPVVPSKILSIMSSARPVVACMDAAGDAVRLIAEAKCGIAVAPEDPRGLAEAVSRLYHDSESRRRYGLNGRSYVEARHSLEVATGRFLEVVSMITARDDAAVA